MKKEIKTFIRWLKDNGCYNEYVHEALKHYYSQKDELYNPLGYPTFISLLNRISIEDMINMPMVWRETEQGSKFWVEKEKAWRNFCYLNPKIVF